MGNYLRLAETISNRLSGGVARYCDVDTAFGIKLCLREMIVNAIEHGNLEISYEDKTTAQRDGRYLEFVQERQRMPEYADRTVTIEYMLNSRRAAFRITDQGRGFDHRQMLRRTATEVNEEDSMHGRGLLLTLSHFDRVRYNERGNSVLLIKRFAPARRAESDAALV